MEQSIVKEGILLQTYDDVVIHDGAKIGKNVQIGKGTIIYPNVDIGDNSFIGPYCTIGEPTAGYYKNPGSHCFRETIIGEGSVIRSNSIIYEDVKIGTGFQSGHRMTIREKATIGNHCSIGTLSDLQGRLKIGNHCRIHSNVFVGEYSIIEDCVWIYPHVVLTNDPYPPMGRLKGVVVRSYAQICASAVVFPGIEIGKNALVGAMAAVRSNVAPERVVVGNPGRDICSVRDLKDDNNEQIYPWRDYLQDYRGYPWQSK